MLIPLAGGIAVTMCGSLQIETRITPDLAAGAVETSLLVAIFGAVYGTIGGSCQGMALVTQFLYHFTCLAICSQTMAQWTATLMATIVIDAFATQAASIVLGTFINVLAVASIFQAISLGTQTLVGAVGIAALILTHPRQAALIDILTLAGIVTAKGEAGWTGDGTGIEGVGRLGTIGAHTFIRTRQVDTLEGTTAIVGRTFIDIFTRLTIQTQNHTRWTGTALIRITLVRTATVVFKAHGIDAGLLVAAQNETIRTGTQIRTHRVVAIVAAAMIVGIALVQVYAHRLLLTQVIALGTGAFVASINIDAVVRAVMFTQGTLINVQAGLFIIGQLEAGLTRTGIGT